LRPAALALISTRIAGFKVASVTGFRFGVRSQKVSAWVDASTLGATDFGRGTIQRPVCNRGRRVRNGAVSPIGGF